MFTIISFFQELIKGGVGIRAGGLENFSKINKRGERLFGTREYAHFEVNEFLNSVLPMFMILRKI